MSLYNKDNRHCNSGIRHFRGRAIEVPEDSDWTPSINIKIENDVLIIPHNVEDRKYFCLYFGEIVYYSLMKNDGLLVINISSDDFMVDKIKDVMLGNKYFLNELVWNEIDITYRYDIITLHAHK